MDSYKDKRAYNRMVRARTVLLVSQPFFGCLALQLRLVEDDTGVIDTMAVDGKNIYYCVEFLNELNEQEVVGVVAHEVMHCVYKHFSRRKQRDPNRWNVAGDFVINADLLEAGFTLPGKPIAMNSPPGIKGHLLDPQFKGMSTEEVYERLPEPEQLIIRFGGGKGKGGSGGQQGQKGQGQSQDEGSGGGGGTIIIDMGGCGGVIDAGTLDGEANNHTASETERDWEVMTRVAAATAARKMAGNLPGYLKRIISELAKPHISWREKTQEFIDTCMKSDYSWARPNRRFLSQGLVLPGYIPDGLHKLVFIGDISGSVTQNIMTQYHGEMQGSLDEGTSDELICVYCDAAVHAHKEYIQGDVVKYENIDGGGGGTDFRPALHWVMEHHPDANAIVYLTDMYPNSWDLPDPGIPVLWAAFLPEDALKNIKPPFGDVVHVASGD